MKKRCYGAELAEKLDLPAEAMTAAVKLTIIGRRSALVEHHGGLLGYSGECVEVGVGAGLVRILGQGLSLGAMDTDALLIRGNISAVEYV